jgi:hypothetical protein
MELICLDDVKAGDVLFVARGEPVRGPEMFYLVATSPLCGTLFALGVCATSKTLWTLMNMSRDDSIYRVSTCTPSEEWAEQVKSWERDPFLQRGGDPFPGLGESIHSHLHARVGPQLLAMNEILKQTWKEYAHASETA